MASGAAASRTRSRHDYALRGLLFCGICGRRMQGHWANTAPYYRCRFPSEYAFANRVCHPLNVTLRQDALLEPLDSWLAAKFAPRYLPATIDELAAVPIARHDTHAEEDAIDIKIAECDRKITQYRAALDAGADPATVAGWLTETEAERVRYKAVQRAKPQQPAVRSVPGCCAPMSLDALPRRRWQLRDVSDHPTTGARIGVLCCGGTHRFGWLNGGTHQRTVNAVERERRQTSTGP